MRNENIFLLKCVFLLVLVKFGAFVVKFWVALESRILVWGQMHSVLIYSYIPFGNHGFLWARSQEPPMRV